MEVAGPEDGRMSVPPDLGGSEVEVLDVERARAESAMGFLESGSVPDREDIEKLPSITDTPKSQASSGTGHAPAVGIMSLSRSNSTKEKKTGRSHPEDDTPLKDKKNRNPAWMEKGKGNTRDLVLKKGGGMFPALAPTREVALAVRNPGPKGVYAPTLKDKERVMAREALEEESLRAAHSLYLLQLDMNEWLAKVEGRRETLRVIMQEAEESGMEVDKCNQSALVLHDNETHKMGEYHRLCGRVEDARGVERIMFEHVLNRVRGERDQVCGEVTEKRAEMTRLDVEIDQLSSALLRARDQQEEAERSLAEFRIQRKNKRAEQQDYFLLENKRVETQANILKERQRAMRRRQQQIQARKNKRLLKIEKNLRERVANEGAVHDIHSMSAETKMKQLESAFIRIREVTGLVDAEEIAERFLTRNATLESLSAAKLRSEDRKSMLLEEVVARKGEQDSILMTGYDRRFRWREFDNLERKTGVWETRLTDRKSDHESVHGEILAVQASLEAIALKTACEPHVHAKFEEVMKHLWVREPNSPEDDEGARTSREETQDRDPGATKKSPADTRSSSPKKGEPPATGAEGAEGGGKGGKGTRANKRGAAGESAAPGPRQSEVEGEGKAPVAPKPSSRDVFGIVEDTKQSRKDAFVEGLGIDTHISSAMEMLESRLYSMLAAGEAHRSALEKAVEEMEAADGKEEDPAGEGTPRTSRTLARSGSTLGQTGAAADGTTGSARGKASGGKGGAVGRGTSKESLATLDSETRKARLREIKDARAREEREAEAAALARQVHANNVRVAMIDSPDTAYEGEPQVNVRSDRGPIYDDDDFFARERRKAALAALKAEEAGERSSSAGGGSEEGKASTDDVAPGGKKKGGKGARGRT